MSTLRAFCTKPPVTAQRHESLRAVAQRMRDAHVGCVVVTEEGVRGDVKPIGILTDRDIVIKALAQTDRYLEQVRVDDIMVQPPVTLGDDAEVAQALRTMRSVGIRRIPIVNQAGALVGLVSIDDLFAHYEHVFGTLGVLVQHERGHESSPVHRR